jgi:hypothetical protein
MNMLDMYTREKANKAHLDEMHREAKTRHLLRNASQDGNAENTSTKRRAHLALAFAALIILFSVFLAVSVMGF